MAGGKPESPPTNVHAAMDTVFRSGFISTAQALRLRTVRMPAVGEACAVIRSLDFSEWPGITAKQVVAAAADCPETQRLVLFNCVQAGIEGLASIAAFCPRLQHITVPCSNEGLAALAKHCPQLRSLVIDHIAWK